VGRVQRRGGGARGRRRLVRVLGAGRVEGRRSPPGGLGRWARRLPVPRRRSRDCRPQLRARMAVAYCARRAAADF
jgi:hypothetical protein